MRSASRSLLLVTGLGLAVPAVCVGGEAYDASAARGGAAIYRVHCATCHGPAGKGNGPMAARLTVVPPDLTRLSRGNGGKYPFDRVYRIIDGREVVPGHGGSGMPIWGDAFLEAREGYSAEKVKERITQVTHYLASLQTR
jgi:mono/diheme cytochrome c family protein